MGVMTTMKAGTFDTAVSIMVLELTVMETAVDAADKLKIDYKVNVQASETAQH